MSNQNSDALTSTEVIIDKNSTKTPPLEFTSIKQLYEEHKDTMHPYITEMYKNYFMYSLDRKSQLVKDKETWRTNIKSPITHMYVSGVYNMTIDSDVRFVCIDKKGDKGEANSAILDIGESLAGNEGTDESIWSAVFDAVLLGFGFFGSAWIYKKDEIEVLNKDMKKEIIEDVIDYGYLRYISPYNIFGPRYRNKFDKRIECERRLIPATMLHKSYSAYGIKFNLKEINEKGSYVDTMDWEAIKENIPFHESTDGADLFDDAKYNIKDKMLEVFECRTDNSVSIWVNSMYYGTFPSLGPLKRIPTYTIQFKKVPGMSRGIGVGYIVKPIQEVYDSILNMRIDNVKLTLNKVFFMDQSANIFGNTTTMKLRPGAIIKVRDVNQVKEMQVSEIKQSAYTELDSMFQMTQGLIGVSAPGLGMQQKVERTAAGAEILKNAADNQLKPLLKSISSAMGQAMKDLIILTYYYMDDETLKRICTEEGYAAFKALDIKGLMHDFDFTYDMTSQSSESLSIKRQQLMSLIEIAKTTFDSAQKPVYDIRVIAEELAKTYNLDFDANMTEEKFKALADAIQKEQQQFTMTQGAPAADSQAMADQEKAAMNTMNQMGGAAVPTEQMPNPVGVTE